MISVRLTGLSGIADRLFDDYDQKIGNDLLTKLILMSPVDTGDFRRDWQIDFSPAGFRIINNKAYATALWFGHSKQAPNGTFQAAVDSFT